MDEYINKTKLIEDIKSRFCKECDPGSGRLLCRNCRASITIGELEGAPTAEVEEVKHGFWINHFDDLFPVESTIECSVCHEEEFMSLCNDNRCPNCGAKNERR